MTAKSLSVTVESTTFSKYRVQFIGRGGALLAETDRQPRDLHVQGRRRLRAREACIESNGDMAWVQPIAVRR